MHVRPASCRLSVSLREMPCRKTAGTWLTPTWNSACRSTPLTGLATLPHRRSLLGEGEGTRIFGLEHWVHDHGLFAPTFVERPIGRRAGDLFGRGYSQRTVPGYFFASPIAASTALPSGASELMSPIAAARSDPIGSPVSKSSSAIVCGILRGSNSAAPAPATVWPQEHRSAPNARRQSDHGQAATQCQQRGKYPNELRQRARRLVAGSWKPPAEPTWACPRLRCHAR